MYMNDILDRLVDQRVVWKSVYAEKSRRDIIVSSLAGALFPFSFPNDMHPTTKLDGAPNLRSSTEMSPVEAIVTLEWSKDSENASNWSLPKRIYNTAIPALLCLSMSVSSHTPHIPPPPLTGNIMHEQILWLGHLLPFSQ